MVCGNSFPLVTAVQSILSGAVAAAWTDQAASSGTEAPTPTLRASYGPGEGDGVKRLYGMQDTGAWR